MSNKLVYVDNAVVNSSSITAVSEQSADVAEIGSLLSFIVPINYVTLENYGIDLNDNTTIFFQSYDTAGWLSSCVSGLDGVFSSPPQITFIFANGSYSSSGIALYFWQNYCSKLRIDYYYNKTLLDSSEYDCEELIHFFEKTVENYNKIVVTFIKTQVAYQFVKLQYVEFGRTIELDEVFRINVLEEMSATGEDLAINTLEVNLISEKGFNFQDDQTLTYYHNNKSIGTFYITSAKKETDVEYLVTAENSIGNLDNSKFMGGIYNNILAQALVSQIMSKSKVRIYLSPNISRSYLTGWLPICSCRQALVQVAFALGAVIDTSRSGLVYIRKPSSSVSSIITSERILGTSKYEKKERVTGVNLTGFKYGIQKTNSETVFEGTANRQVVEFSKPMYSLVNSSGATIHNFSPNYMVISGSNFELKAYPYVEQKFTLSMNTVNTSSRSKENITEYSQYTLISESNADTRLAEMYNNSIKNLGTVTADIILEDEKPGDLVQIETKYSGTITGIIISLDIRAGNQYLTATAVIEQWL